SLDVVILGPTFASPTADRYPRSEFCVQSYWNEPAGMFAGGETLRWARPPGGIRGLCGTRPSFWWIRRISQDVAMSEFHKSKITAQKSMAERAAPAARSGEKSFRNIRLAAVALVAWVPAASPAAIAWARAGSITALTSLVQEPVYSWLVYAFCTIVTNASFRSPILPYCSVLMIVSIVAFSTPEAAATTAATEARAALIMPYPRMKLTVGRRISQKITCRSRVSESARQVATAVSL